jgi:hypothetical protein
MNYKIKTLGIELPRRRAAVNGGRWTVDGGR